MNGSDEFGFAERFADNHCIRLAHPQPSSIAADEHVCERPRSEYFLDSGNAASPTQPGIHDHQVRAVASGSPIGSKQDCPHDYQYKTHGRGNMPYIYYDLSSGQK